MSEAEPTLSEAVKKIVVDNREVPIEEAPEVLKNMESSLRSDYTKKMQEVKKEKEETGTKLKTDIDWFSSHDRRIWHLYMPTVEGGTGYVGTEKQLTQFDNENSSEDDLYSEPKQHKRAFEIDPEIKSLRSKIAELEVKQMRIEEETFNAGTDRVIETKSTIIRKYPNASEKLVVDKLGSFFDVNHRHPTSSEIEGIIKNIHEEVTKILTRQSKGTEMTGKPEKTSTTTPDITGETVKTEKSKKVLSMENKPDDLVKSIFGRLQGGT